MSDNNKPLVIKVASNAIPSGTAHKWTDFTDQMPTFTKSIITPAISNDKDGNSSVNIGTIVSGMPSIFARANLFKLSLDYITDKNADSTGLLSFYSSLVNEWRGIIASIALDYVNYDIERIYLGYSDGESISKTTNLYEPKGAFGNMLFERKLIWCDQGLAQNEKKTPFIDVLKYKGQVVGGTSPDSFLFTSVAYSINDKSPFVDINNKKFTDPLRSDLTPEQLNVLHAYVEHILLKINLFKDYYKDLPNNISLSPQNIHANLSNWLQEIKDVATKKGIDLNNASIPPVDKFQKPFSVLFNFSSELWGSEGTIYEVEQNDTILFDPKKLLLPKTAEIARLDFGNCNPQNLSKQPIHFLKAEIKGMSGHYYYFALPFSPLALNVFGKNIGALVGMSKTTIASRIFAEFDPSITQNNLKVKLTLKTNDGKEKTFEEVYTVGATPIRGHDILIWPNFISKQWNRYFMYSELPHNVNSPNCPYKATPFVGDVNDTFFRILIDEKSNPICLAKDGNITIPVNKKDVITSELHIVADNRVSDNQYKYEIYECNQPFKGVKLNIAGKESGYLLIRYSSENDGLPNNLLEDVKNLSEANLGIDFGSTNTSVAYFANNRVVDDIVLKNRCISLLSSDDKDNSKIPAFEHEVFFFQNDEIRTNAIKSVFTLHDPKRYKQGSTNLDIEKAVKAGFPCFEKNLPIDSATENRYKLAFNRIGTAEIVHNMKWSTVDLENSYKKSYLATLLLHIYAQLFEDNCVPVRLKWSYPSSMSNNLIGKYNLIWSSLIEVNPINPTCDSFKKLNVLKANTSVDIVEGTFSGVGNTGGWGNSGGENTGGGWGNSTTQETTSAWGAPQNQVQPAVQNSNGWGGNNQPTTRTPVAIEISQAPIKFNFKTLGDDECLTESCAVANFIANNHDISKKPESLILSFDIGGSTTDISALCLMNGNGVPGLALVKQNSIRFAAQRLAFATKSAPNFQKVLIEMCDKKQIKLQGLNEGNITYKPETAPYYFEQMVDRLEESDFPVFYELIRGKCPELMCVNIYITGLIMYYAGQLAAKLVEEIRKSDEKLPGLTEWKPTVNVVLSGKGARIFDWFKSVDSNSADKYSQNLFIAGFGGMQKAYADFSNAPIINATNKSGYKDIKYEVSKGLAQTTEGLLVPQNNTAIELIGEDGFVVYSATGTTPLKHTDSITPEMMENMETNFYINRQAGQPSCPKFMEFAGIFFQVATSLFGLKMTQKDFMYAFDNMKIEPYIKNLPEFYAAKESKKITGKFDFVAPIIILEGMKFYDEYLLKGISK